MRRLEDIVTNLLHQLKFFNQKQVASYYIQGTIWTTYTVTGTYVSKFKVFCNNFSKKWFQLDLFTFKYIWIDR